MPRICDGDNCHSCVCLIISCAFDYSPPQATMWKRYMLIGIFRDQSIPPPLAATELAIIWLTGNRYISAENFLLFRSLNNYGYNWWCTSLCAECDSLKTVHYYARWGGCHSWTYQVSVNLKEFVSFNLTLNGLFAKCFQYVFITES